MRPACRSQRSSSPRYSRPPCGSVSRPSAKAWKTTSGTPSWEASSIVASMCSQPEWTPPSETKPSKCRRPRGLLRARSQAPSRASLSKKLPSAIESSIRARSCLTIAPAPRLRCPTSEFPICPGGSPTSRPEVERVVCGYELQSSSKTGVFACETALPGPSWASPQPSRITSASEGTGMSLGPGGIGLIGWSGRRGDDRREVIGIEARPTHQRTVDVLLRDQLGRVVGLDGAAIENPDRHRRARGACPDQAPDQGDRLLRLVWRRRAAGADRPDRLVGDHDVAEAVVGHVREVGADLPGQD